MVISLDGIDFSRNEMKNSLSEHGGKHDRSNNNAVNAKSSKGIRLFEIFKTECNSNKTRNKGNGIR